MTSQYLKQNVKTFCSATIFKFIFVIEIYVIWENVTSHDFKLAEVNSTDKCSEKFFEAW